MNQVDTIRQLFTESLPLFSALGDPIRQQLLLLMMDGTRRSVAELASETELSRPTISHHLKILKDAHIVTSQKEGRKIYYCPQMGDYVRPIRELITIVASIEREEGHKN